MEGPAGTQLPEKRVDSFHCGTLYSGWLNGDHPTTLHTDVNREVCFSSFVDKSCQFNVKIQIRNCGDFYLYYLVAPFEFFGNLRFCAE